MTFRHIRITAIGVAALLVTVAFAGCAGDDDANELLTKEQFIVQADQICAQFRADANESEIAFDAAVEEGDLDTAADLLDAHTEQMNVAIQEFAALKPPEEDRETIDEFIALSRLQLEAANEFQVAIRAGDETVLRAADERASALDDEANLIADRYGMVECGSAGKTS